MVTPSSTDFSSVAIFVITSHIFGWGTVQVPWVMFSYNPGINLVVNHPVLYQNIPHGTCTLVLVPEYKGEEQLTGTNLNRNIFSWLTLNTCFQTLYHVQYLVAIRVHLTPLHSWKCDTYSGV